jgi:DoxX-like protein
MSIPADLHLPVLTTDIPRGQIWTGRVLSAIAVLFLMFDAIGKLLRPAPVIEGTTQLGWPVSAILTLGVIQVICLIAYLIPRTSVLGAILWTGYLGGAIATHMRIGNPLFTHVLFPTYIAALLWGGLWLRDRKLRALVPFRSNR